MEGLRITKLTRHEPADRRAYWTANVSMGGTTLAVTRVYGTWMTEPHRHGTVEMKEVHPAVAAELQSKVTTEENRLKKQKEEADDDASPQQPQPSYG